MTPLGLDAKLYFNSGDYATPVWEEVENVKDLSLNLEEGEADITTRGAQGWREVIGTLKDGGVEFQMVWDTTDPDFLAFKNSFFNRTPIELAVMDGDITASGSTGLRASCAVLKFTRTENLEEALMAEVSVKPTRSANPPEWLEIP